MLEQAKEKKIDIIMLGLRERYNVQNTIRNRIETTGLFVFGIFAGLGAWIMKDKIMLSHVHIFFLLFFLFGLYIFLRFFYFKKLQEELFFQQKISVKLEKLLGFYNPNLLDSETDPLYPMTWKTKNFKKTNSFFKATYYILDISFLFTVGILVIQLIS